MTAKGHKRQKVSPPPSLLSSSSPFLSLVLENNTKEKESKAKYRPRTKPVGFQTKVPPSFLPVPSLKTRYPTIS